MFQEPHLQRPKNKLCHIYDSVKGSKRSSATPAISLASQTSALPPTPTAVSRPISPVPMTGTNIKILKANFPVSFEIIGDMLEEYNIMEDSNITPI